MYCEKCGNLLLDKAHFCSACGSPVSVGNIDDNSKKVLMQKISIQLLKIREKKIESVPLRNDTKTKATVDCFCEFAEVGKTINSYIEETIKAVRESEKASKEYEENDYKKGVFIGVVAFFLTYLLFKSFILSCIAAIAVITYRVFISDKKNPAPKLLKEKDEMQRVYADITVLRSDNDYMEVYSELSRVYKSFYPAQFREDELSVLSDMMSYSINGEYNKKASINNIANSHALLFKKNIAGFSGKDEFHRLRMEYDTAFIGELSNFSKKHPDMSVKETIDNYFKSKNDDDIDEFRKEVNGLLKNIDMRYRQYLESQYEAKYVEMYHEVVSHVKEAVSKTPSELKISKETYKGMIREIIDSVKGVVEEGITKIVENEERLRKEQEENLKRQELEREIDKAGYRFMELLNYMKYYMLLDRIITNKTDDYLECFSEQYISVYKDYLIRGHFIFNAFSHIQIAVEKNELKLLENIDQAEKYVMLLDNMIENVYESFIIDFSMICSEYHLEDEFVNICDLVDEMKEYYFNYSGQQCDNDDSQTINTKTENMGFFVGCNTFDELKKRYKALARVYHPDTETGNNELMQEINNQFEELKKKYE